MARLTGPLIIDLLLAAVGVAINPPAIIASIVLVSSSRSKAMAFAGGWLVGLLMIGSAIMLVGDVSELVNVPSSLMLAVKLAVGTALVMLALAQWRKHSASSGTAEPPRWMRSLTDLSAPRAFWVATAYASLNPKTLVFVVAGVLTILETSLRVPAEWIALVLFVLLASLSVTTPVVLAVLAPRRSAGSLASARRWLGDNGSLVTAAVLAILGVMVLYSGVASLLQLT